MGVKRHELESDSLTFTAVNGACDNRQLATTNAGPTVEPTQSHDRHSSHAKLLYPLLLLLIVIGFYWKLTLTRQYDWVWGPDIAQQVLPWFEEQARQLQHGRPPLWDPHNWAGAPFLGQAQPGTAYPLNWILFLIPRDQGHIRMEALQWYFIVIHYMAALFCYLLCRDLGRSHPASLIGALIFALAGYIGTTEWPQMINGAVWTPLVVMFTLRAVHGRRPFPSAVLAGLFLGMAWLSGHHQVPIYLTLTVCGIWLYYIFRDGWPAWRLARLAVLMLAFMMLVGALQVIPAEEYGSLAKRWAGAKHEIVWNEPVPYYVHQAYSLNPISFFGIVFPGLHRNADPFIGVVALTLAVLAVGLAWKQWQVKVFGAIAIAGLVYALGYNSVFHGLIYAIVPMVDKARVPSMATVIFSVGMSVLASFGVDFFQGRTDSVWAKRINNGVLVFGAVTLVLLLTTLFAKKLTWDVDDRVALTAFIAVLAGILLYAWRSGNLGRSTALTVLTMLLLLELGNNSGYSFIHREDATNQAFIEKVRGDDDIAQYLQKQPGPFRIETEGDKLVPNWAEYHNYDTLTALCPSVTTNLIETEFHTWQTRMLFGVRYTLGEKPPLPDSQEVFTAARGVKVFYNRPAFPRVWSVHSIISIPTREDGLAIIRDHLDDLHIKAFKLGQAPALESCAEPDNVSVSNYTPDKVRIKAAMSCQGMVILSDTYFPGWYAQVDHKSAPIYEVNAAMRGVVVPKGSHELVMRYRPRSVYFGLGLTLLGVIAAVFIGFGSRAAT